MPSFSRFSFSKSQQHYKNGRLNYVHILCSLLLSQITFSSSFVLFSGRVRVISRLETKPSYLSSQNESSTFRNDISAVTIHMASCLIFASALTAYEGFDCSYLKPLSSTIRNYPDVTAPLLNSNENTGSLDLVNLMVASTRGMGRGAIDRSDGWYQDTYLTSKDSIRQDDQSARNILSYNEIMLQHRTSRVPEWRQEEINKEDVVGAVDGIVQALETINELKQNAEEYEWDRMLIVLQEPSLTTNLQSSCSLLQRARGFLSIETRKEIGFDWGSCAWRHCGAQADAQESLAELYNSVGMFEPFECLFTLDIVERSLRDIITVLPGEFKPDKAVLNERIGEYVPYLSSNSEDNEEDEIDSIDRDFVNALANLRSDWSDSVYDDGQEE